MKNKLPLIIGVSLPVIFIIIISIVIFAPSLFVKPQYNFLYTQDNSYYSYNQTYQYAYKVENNRVTLDPVFVPIINGQSSATEILPKSPPPLYLFDVKNGSTHQISLEEVQKYFVDPGPSSPDGYTVSYQYNHDGIFELFGSSNENNGYFISNDSGKKRLNGLSGDRYYFKLIGWIK